MWVDGDTFIIIIFFPGKEIIVHLYRYSFYRASLVPQMVKNLPAMQETQVLSPGQEDPLEEGMATHSLPGESHGQRSLVGYRPWGCK